VDQVVRPGSIEITTQFVDRDGEAANPDHAYLRIAYSSAGEHRVDQIAMVRDGDGVTWRGHWSSAAADDGTCCWHIMTDGALPAAQQGKFRVLANWAVPSPTSPTH
jgi:hypothetical protein